MEGGILVLLILSILFEFCGARTFEQIETWVGGVGNTTTGTVPVPSTESESVSFKLYAR